MSELRLPKVNNIVLSGRLTRDVELRYTQSNVAVAKMSLAFDRSYQKNGEWINETSYVDLVVWNKRAEQCAEQLHKGSPVMVEGYLQTRSYVDKDNNNRKAVEVVCQRVHFLEKGEQGESSEQAPEIDNSDVPF